ncbi:MAG: hypothetical protein Q7J27_08540 [Syntrophales bacterium]|nr:hypothetical protein [Syntrophales bacterium]
MIDFLIELVKQYGLWVLAVAFIVFLLRILLDEDKSSVWRAKFYKAAFSLTGQRDKEKKFISNDAKGKLNLARRAMHFGQSILPKAVEVVWVHNDSPGAYDLKDGEFVVKLDPSERQEKNIATLATILVQKTTLQGIRHSVDKPIQVAIDMNLVKNLLKELGQRSVFDWFVTNEYQLTVNADADCKRRNEQLLAIDERGLFTRMLLVELDEFSKKVYGMAPKPTMAQEVAGLIDFLFVLVTKQPKQLVPLDYVKTYFRIYFILVAKTNKILTGGIGPYVFAMNNALKKNLGTVYVLSYDKDWLGEADSTALEEFNRKVKELEKELSIRTIAIQDFKLDYSFIDQEGKRRHATCIRYKAPSKH